MIYFAPTPSFFLGLEHIRHLHILFLILENLHEYPTQKQIHHFLQKCIRIDKTLICGQAEILLFFNKAGNFENMLEG